MPLTEKQKKLPKKLQEAIMAKDKKKPIKKQTKKDRLDEAEGKMKGEKKKSQTIKSRLNEAEGKKKEIKETKKIKKRKTAY
tara:strand:+ start:1018 stop:1260 length:243 start_codon:yes stop_codon:yes gene_type:complete